MKNLKKVPVLSLLALAVPLPALSANWQFDPRVEIGAETDDNYRLLPSGSEYRVSGGFGDVRLDMHTIDPVNEFHFAPGVRASFFPGNSADQSTDPYGELDASHRGETYQVSLASNYLKQSVVNSDRVTSDVGGGLGNPGNGDSGYIALRNRRELITVIPSLVYDLTQRDKLNVVLNYADANYEKYIPNTNVGYVSTGGQIGLTHQLTERHAMTIRALYSKNNPDETPVATQSNGSTKSYGLQGEWSMRVSDLSQAYARAGVQRSKFSRVATGGSDAQTTYVAGAGMNWSFQITQLFLDLTRTVDPSSSGYSVERNQVRMRVDRQFSPLVTGFFAVRGLADKAADGSAAFRQRKYVVATVGMEKRFLRQWTLRGEYNYTHQRYDGDPGPGKSNAISVSVIYEPNLSTDNVGRYRH